MKPLRIALLTLAGAAALCAQSATRVVADIPFAFEIANVTFPAGEYVVSEMSTPHCLTVSSYEEKKAAIALGFTIDNNSRDIKETRLVFNKYGDRHFLSQVWAPHIARELVKSKSERALVTTTLITANPRTVTIVARAF